LLLNDADCRAAPEAHLPEESGCARMTRRMTMDGYNMLLLYFAFFGKPATKAGEAQLGVRTIEHRLPMRRRLTRWCGHAALRIGAWLLAEELRTEVEYAEGA
jgi:hypothetical protein